MKSFEEKYTAWLDGTLDPAECERFEANLPDRAGAQRDRAGWQKVRTLMRETLTPAPMPHGDFLSSRVRDEIARSEAPTVRPARRFSWFPVGRLAFAGASLVVLAAVLGFLVVPRDASDGASQYISQVIDARSGDPKQGAYTFAAPDKKGAVLWVTNAGYIPANERLQ